MSVSGTDLFPYAVRVTSDQNLGTATPTTTTLVIQVPVSGNYGFFASIFTTTASSATLNFQIAAFAAGASLLYASATKTASDIVTTTATNIYAAADALASRATMFFGMFTVGTTITSLQINFLNPAAVGTATVKTGSWMTVTPLN